jgi:hypothetical protein
MDHMTHIHTLHVVGVLLPKPDDSLCGNAVPPPDGHLAIVASGRFMSDRYGTWKICQAGVLMRANLDGGPKHWLVLNRVRYGARSVACGLGLHVVS